MGQAPGLRRAPQPATATTNEAAGLGSLPHFLSFCRKVDSNPGRKPGHELYPHLNPAHTSNPNMKAALLALCAITALAQRPSFDAFEVATIRPTPPDWQGGRYYRMQSPQRFAATNYSLRFLIAVAYNLTLQTVSGGPGWIDAERYDIQAVTPGEVRPTVEEQMRMLRKLLEDRFHLRTHHEEKVMPVYILTLAKDGPKLKQTQSTPGDLTEVINRISPEGVTLPARNAPLSEVVAVMQRTILEKPILDKTGLTGRYDFDLEWTPDDSQFGGLIPRDTFANATQPNLFEAMQTQLGLKLEAARSAAPVLVIDNVERPSEN